MNMEKTIHPVEVIKNLISDAEKIAAAMLAERVDNDLQIAYSRSIVRACDRLTEVKLALDSVAKALIECEDKLNITGHFTEYDDRIPELKSDKLHRSSSRDLEQDKGLPVKNNGQSIMIEVTEGMIRQSLLKFTGFMSHRGGPFKLNSPIKLVLNGELVTSEIIAPGNKLRERGAISRFYKDLNIIQGDGISLTLDNEGYWHATVERQHFSTSKIFNL